MHAIRILRHLAAVPRPLGVAAIARATGISPSTCFNILRTLARARLCAFRAADKTYTLGMAVAELSVGLVGLSHAELLRPELERLALNYDMLIVLWRGGGGGGQNGKGRGGGEGRIWRVSVQ